MSNNELDLKKAYKSSINHKESLIENQKCGCFYCCKIFNSNEIVDWIEDIKGTAICPYCGIDSVIGESSDFPITIEFLSRMRKKYFY